MTKYLVEEKMDFKKDNNGSTPLHYANNAEITQFLAEKFDFNQENNDKQTPLTQTVDLESAKYLIESKGVDYNTNLFYNVKNNSLGILKYLIQIQNFDSNLEDENGKSILIDAAERGLASIVQYLVNVVKLDINKKDHFNKTATDYANNYKDIKRFFDEMNNLKEVYTFGSLDIFEAIKKNSVNVAKHFFDTNGVDPSLKEDGKWPLIHLATNNSAFEVVKFLVDEKNVSVYSIDYQGNIPVHMNTSLDILKFFLEDKEVNVDSENYSKNTPLHQSAANNNIQAVKYLAIDKKANYNLTNNANETALDIAKSNGYKEIFKILDLIVNSNPNITEAAEFGNLDALKYYLEKKNMDPNFKKGRDALIHFASITGQIEVAKYLVNKHNVSANLRNYLDGCPIHLACYYNHLNIVKWLIEDQNINIDILGAFNQTPLHYAALTSGTIEIVKYLIDKKANYTLKDEGEGRYYEEIPTLGTPYDFYVDQKTALDLAKSNNNTEVFKYLDLVMHSNPNIFGAAQNGDLEALKYYLEKKNMSPNLKKDGKWPLLHLAIDNGHLELIKYLVKRKVDPYSKNFENNCPIHIACMNNYLNIVQYFAKDLKIDIDVRGYEDSTPLHISSSNENRIEIVKYLINKNANYNLKDKSGQTALDIAKSKGNKKIVEYLESVMRFSFFKFLLEENYLTNKIGFYSNLHLNETIGRPKLIHSSTSTQKSNLNIQNDVNGTLMLLNVFVRKLTQEKFISGNEQSLSVLDAKMYALNILDEFERLISKLANKFGLSIDFDPTSLIADLEWYLRNEKFNEISKLLITVLNKNVIEFELKNEFLKEFENELKISLANTKDSSLSTSTKQMNTLVNNDYETLFENKSNIPMMTNKTRIERLN